MSKNKRAGWNIVAAIPCVDGWCVAQVFSSMEEAYAVAYAKNEEQA